MSTAFSSEIAALTAADPVLGALIDRVGPCAFEPDAQGSHFEALVRAIVFQQLSTKAARTIYGRVQALFGDAPTPEALLALPDEPLRAAGVSRQKLGYLRDLAGRVAAGELPLAELDALEDEALIRSLTQVKGIGRWSGQMFLIFRLGRPDVLPDGDLGIQNAIWRAYGLAERPTPNAVRTRGEVWAPYRTIASWYLWRSLDPGAPLPGR